MQYYKQVVTILIIMCFSVTAHAGYYKKTVDGKVIAKKLALEGGSGWELIEGDPGLVKVYQEPIVTYEPQDLKEWAMEQLFAAELIPHFAAFLDFANSATDRTASLFRLYAANVGLTDTANTIIAKAIELGATISTGE